ncbi:hypothetical protein J2T13_003618 [Paenibacillus sp. DS2015]|uniref:hypothetical protein n=1 Tax=Paenibacillus sp. DS2015 TaxID=3373917 RepID=UPI003D22B155
MRVREPISAMDQRLVKKYLLLPLILTAFERDNKIMGSDLFKTPIYSEVIEKAMMDVTLELSGVRKEFLKRGIKVYEEHRYVDGVHAYFKCRGLTGEMSMRWEFVTAEVSVLMRKYLGLI